MKISEEGIKLIKDFESLKLEAYLPTEDDVWTIGYGTTRIDGRPVHQGEKITKDRATQLLYKDLEFFENSVNRYVKVELTQNMFDALVSFVYNIGAGAFSKSTLLKKLNAEDFAGAKKEFSRWNKQAGKVLNGLTRRREAESQLFGDFIEKPKKKKNKKTTEELVEEHKDFIDEVLNGDIIE